MSNTEKKEFIPYNKNKIIGPRDPIRSEDVLILRNILTNEAEASEALNPKPYNGNYFRLALFELGLCSALRSGDLLSIRINDVVDFQNNIVDSFLIRQSKTYDRVKKNLTVFIPKKTKEVLEKFVFKRPRSQYLFASWQLKFEKPISRKTHTNIIKNEWATSLNDYIVNHNKTCASGKQKDLYDISKMATHSVRRGSIHVMRDSKVMSEHQMINITGHNSVATLNGYTGESEKKLQSLHSDVFDCI